MPEYIIFDPSSTPVAGRIIEMYYSVPPQVVAGKENCLKISRNVYNSLTKFHKVVSGEVVEMSQQEKDDVIAAEQAAAEAAEAAKIAAINGQIASINIEEITMAESDAEINAIQNFDNVKTFLKKLVRYIAKYGMAVVLCFVSLTAYCGVDLNGDGDHLLVTGGDGSDFDPAQQLFTVTCWVKTDQTEGSGSAWLIIADQGNTDDWAFIMSDASDSIRFQITTDAGATATADSGVDIRDGAWHHLAGVRTGTKECKIYVDGDWKATGSHAEVSTSIDITSNVYIGTDTDGSSLPYNGKQSEIAYWLGVALSASEIKLLASSRIKGMPLQIQSANLKLYLPLDEHPAGTGINGVTFNDLSGNGNNGTGVDADADSLVVGESILSYPPGVIGGL